MDDRRRTPSFYTYACCSGENAKLASVTDPLGNTTTFDYDGVGNLVKQTDPMGHYRTMTYDMNRNMSSITDEDGRTTSFEYDAANRQTAIVAPGGAVEQAAYDNAGRITSRTDPLNRVTRYEYDLAGRLTATVDALGGRTSFTYDAVGNRLSVTDALSHTTTFTYDAMNRQLTETDPLNRTRTNAYDAAGRVTSTTDAKGQNITYAYDNANRLTSKKYPDNFTETYTYDNNGNLLRTVNTAVTMSYTYDKRNALLTIKNETINKTVGYAYDVNGRKTSLTYPDGETISYTRDPRGQVTELADNGQRTTVYTYTPSRALSSMDYSFGMHVARAYDTQTGRLNDLKYTKPDNSIISDFAYTHDTTGNILTKTTDFGNIVYGYDALNRLTSAQYSWKPEETFTYDAIGNRLTSADFNNWQYDSANQLLNYGNGSNPAFTFTYDANGSTVSKTDTANNQTTQYLYNFDNRMSEAQQGGSTIAKYFYDLFAQRVMKDLYVSGSLSSSTWFVYGQEGLLAEYANTGALVKKYAWLPDQPCGKDPMWQKIDSGECFYYVNDHLSTPQKMIDISFNNQWQGDWSTFGDITPVMEKISNQLRFPGQYFDNESKLLFNLNRFYEPEIGRYFQKDPLIYDFKEYDAFVYVGNNPVSQFDNLGLDTLSDMYDIAKRSNLSGFSDELVICQAWLEGRFSRNPSRPNPARKGPLQMGKSEAESMGYRWKDLNDFEIAFEAGTVYLHYLANKYFNYDPGSTLAAYNKGAHSREAKKGGNSYSRNILCCEKCLKQHPRDMSCLTRYIGR